MRISRWAVGLFAVTMAAWCSFPLAINAQRRSGNAQPTASGPPRARPPQFDAQEVAGTFFDDPFSKLIGARPDSFRVVPSVAAGGKEPVAEGAGSGGGIWKEAISPVSIEDEVKAIKLVLDQAVTTPTSFRGQGHEVARVNYTLLAVLFSVIDQYDGEVRWKEEARPALQQFASVAGNSKAGGNEQVYTQAKRSLELLERMLRGERLDLEAAEVEDLWGPVTPRPPLMELLEQRFEVHLKQWTSSEGEFSDNVEDVVREAELVAMIAKFLQVDGLPDSADEEYRKFAQSLYAGARGVVDGVKLNNFEAAQQGVSAISRSCSDCHDIYR